MVQTTNGWANSAKHLKAKVKEYDERLAANGRSNSNPRTGSNGIQLVQSLMEENERQKANLEALAARLQDLQDLPADVEQARDKVENARKELRALVEKRDRQFEDLAKA
jgi:HAUS augmin-like complex subunit 1